MIPAIKEVSAWTWEKDYLKFVRPRKYRERGWSSF